MLPSTGDRGYCILSQTSVLETNHKTFLPIRKFLFKEQDKAVPTANLIYYSVGSPR